MRKNHCSRSRLDDQVAAALAGAVGQDLLVGQHGLAAGAPVDRGRLRGRPGPPPGTAGRSPGSTGCTPGRGCGPRGASRRPAPSRWRLAFSSSIRASVNTRGWVPVLMAAFSAGRPKLSNPIGLQHAVAVHGAVADDQVAEGVVAHVAQVGRARRVGVHAEHVERRPGVVVVDLVGALVGPPLLPAGLDLLHRVGGGAGPRPWRRIVPAPPSRPEPIRRQRRPRAARVVGEGSRGCSRLSGPTGL